MKCLSKYRTDWFVLPIASVSSKSNVSAAHEEREREREREHLFPLPGFVCSSNDVNAIKTIDIIFQNESDNWSLNFEQSRKADYETNTTTFALTLIHAIQGKHLFRHKAKNMEHLINVNLNWTNSAVNPLFSPIWFVLGMTLNCIWWQGSSMGSTQLLPGPLWLKVVVPIKSIKIYSYSMGSSAKKKKKKNPVEIIQKKVNMNTQWMQFPNIWNEITLEGRHTVKINQQLLPRKQSLLHFD